MRSRSDSNPRPGRNHGTFGNADDAVTDVEVLAVHLGWLAFGRDDDVVADVDVFVDDGALDAAVAADAWWWACAVRACGAGVVVRTHDDGVADGGAGLDLGAHADDGGLDVGIGDDATIGNECMMNGGPVDLGGRERT